MQTNMKVGGLTSTFQVCIVHFLVFWGPGKFGLKKGTGGDPPSPRVTMSPFFYRFSYCGASLIAPRWCYIFLRQCYFFSLRGRTIIWGGVEPLYVGD